MLGDYLDTVTAAAILVFPNKYHKDAFAAPNLGEVLLNIKALQRFGCPVRKTGENHPGLKSTSGHIGFLGHGSLVWFRNMRIKEL